MNNFVIICVYMYIHIRAHIQCVRVGQESMSGVFFNCFPPYYFEKGSLSPELLIQQAMGILHFPSSRILGVQCHAQLLYGLWCYELTSSCWYGQHYTN